MKINGFVEINNESDILNLHFLDYVHPSTIQAESVFIGYNNKVQLYYIIVIKGTIDHPNVLSTRLSTARTLNVKHIEYSSMTYDTHLEGVILLAEDILERIRKKSRMSFHKKTIRKITIQ